MLWTVEKGLITRGPGALFLALLAQARLSLQPAHTLLCNGSNNAPEQSKKDSI
jgi:hypothetical protein